MGKISPVSIKYIVHADLQLSGMVEKPDIIGAVFGQTEGLLGSDLELRELQKSGRIGRIDVKLETKNGITSGEILLPSSMGKSETTIIAAALETIERVGPCDAKIKVSNIEDVRISKRSFILDRAKQLLQNLISDQPDSQVFTSAITQEVRTLEVMEYGPDKLPAGPKIDDSEEIIIVEGRADVLTLLRYGIRNVVALKGARATDTIIDLIKRKIVTLFIDGDRGGDLIIKRLSELADIDYVARAPDGKEVEELTLKEIHKALRLKIAWEQTKAELPPESEKNNFSGIQREEAASAETIRQMSAPSEHERISRRGLKQLKSMADELLGTRGAFVLDENLNILGRVPVKELADTLQNMSEGVFAIVMDGAVDPKLSRLAEAKNIKFIIAKNSTGKNGSTEVLASENL